MNNKTTKTAPFQELPTSKAIIYSPLLGGILVSIVLNIYAFFMLVAYYQINNIVPDNMDIFKNLLVIVPSVFTVTNIFSYILFVPALFFLKYLQKKYNLKEKELWFYMFAFGSTLGALLGIFAFDENNIFRTILLTCSLGFGLLFNFSLFSTLTKKV